MISAADKTAELQEIWVAEFGVLNNNHIDFTRKYQGRLYRWSPEAMRAVCEAVGFNARFDMPNIRSLYMDIYRAEGHVVFEYDRNTKPSEISVRYSRDRWLVQELTGKGQEGLRPWIKTEYHARHLDPKVLAPIADQLHVRLDDLSNFVLRFNFREKTYGILAEERNAEAMPIGAFSHFRLPAKGVSTITTAEVTDEEFICDDHPDSDTAGGGTYYQQQSQYAGANMMTQQQEPITEHVAETEAAPAPAEAVAAPVAAEPVEHTPTAVEAPAVVAAGGSPLAEPTQSPAAAPTVESIVVSTATPSAPPAEHAEPTIVKPAMPTATPMALAAAQAHGPRKASKNEQPFSPAEFQRSSAAAVAAKPRHTPAPERNYAPRTDFSQGEVKYATYSKSEVDYMMKQQADSILNALSGKVAAQQRAFQEAIASQEKAFNKLSDNFVAQFDVARVKLEQTTRHSQESTKTELDTFHKELSKELEEYRKQVSKTVAKVSEGGKAAAQQKESQAKPANIPPKAQQVLTEGQAKLQNLVMLTMVISVVSVVLSAITLLSHAH
ncbi:MAG TPA: hypothetical protein V6D22_16635 [Candidatus Obscuribacterales bacterium]